MGNDALPLTDHSLQRELLSRIAALRSHVEWKVPGRLRGLINADDVLQEVWIAAYRNLGRFTPNGPDAIDRWLSAIARSKIVDAIRAARRLKRGGDRYRVDDARRRMTSLTALFEQVQSPTKTPSSDARRMERAHAVSIALNRLAADRRQAVYMRHVEGLSRPEIARRMDATVAAVSSLIYNGLRDLRSFLGEVDEYFSDIKSADSTRH